MGVRPFERIQTLRKSGPTVFINEYSTSAALSAQTQARTGPREVPAPDFIIASDRASVARFNSLFFLLPLLQCSSSTNTRVLNCFCSNGVENVTLRLTAHSILFFSIPYPIQPLTSTHHTTTNPACLRPSAHQSLDVSFHSSFWYFSCFLDIARRPAAI